MYGQMVQEKIEYFKGRVGLMTGLMEGKNFTSGHVVNQSYKEEEEGELMRFLRILWNPSKGFSEE
jgi:hypothetical protein